MTTKSIKAATISTLAAKIVGIASKTLDLRAESQSVSQQIAGRIKANGMTAKDRGTDTYKAFNESMRKAVRETHTGNEDIKVQALHVLKTQLSYAWNIVCNVGDSNGRTLPVKTGANVATKKPTAEQASAPATKQVEMKVTREAALAFMATALGGNVAENEFALGYMLDNASVMRQKLVTLVKVQFESEMLRKAA